MAQATRHGVRKRLKKSECETPGFAAQIRGFNSGISDRYVRCVRDRKSEYEPKFMEKHQIDLSNIVNNLGKILQKQIIRYNKIVITLRIINCIKNYENYIRAVYIPVGTSWYPNM